MKLETIEIVRQALLVLTLACMAGLVVILTVLVLIALGVR